MRGIKTILMIPAVALLLLVGACTSNGLDDGDSADVILEILGFNNPPVTATVNTTGFCSMTTTTACATSADCPQLEICSIGGCSLTVVDWAVSFSNVPKNSLAAAPGNDIALIDVLITYNFPAGSPAPHTFGLGGQVIPTGGSGSVTFPPIALQDLVPALLSSTGSLVLDFRAQTLEGTAIHLVVGRALTVEECL